MLCLSSVSLTLRINNRPLSQWLPRHHNSIMVRAELHDMPSNKPCKLKEETITGQVKIHSCVFMISTKAEAKKSVSRFDVILKFTRGLKCQSC